MAGVFHKAMVWLGLAPDDEYDDYQYGDSPRPQPMQGYGGQQGPGVQGGPSRQPRPTPRAVPEPEEDPFGGGRAMPRQQQGRQPMAGQPGSGQPGAVRHLPSRGALENDPRSVRREDTPTVRPMRPTSAKPAVLEPESFDDAKDIADRFKADQPVVMDLGGIDRELSRRLIDFASGICYALGGKMEKVRAGAYLLTPSNVEVSDEERRRLRDGR